MKKSRGVLSEKEKMSKIVKELALSSTSLNVLSEKLQASNIIPYYRADKLHGIWMGKRKLRLTTLGVGKQHLKELTLEQKRLDELEKEEISLDNDLEIEQ